VGQAGGPCPRCGLRTARRPRAVARAGGVDDGGQHGRGKGSRDAAKDRSGGTGAVVIRRLQLEGDHGLGAVAVGPGGTSGPAARRRSSIGRHHDRGSRPPPHEASRKAARRRPRTLDGAGRDADRPHPKYRPASASRHVLHPLEPVGTGHGRVPRRQEVVTEQHRAKDPSSDIAEPRRWWRGARTGSARSEGHVEAMATSGTLWRLRRGQDAGRCRHRHLDTATGRGRSSMMAFSGWREARATEASPVRLVDGGECDPVGAPAPSTCFRQCRATSGPSFPVAARLLLLVRRWYPRHGRPYRLRSG